MIKKCWKKILSVLQYVVPRGDIMEKFNRALRGYDPDEVNQFLDKIISQVEDMVNENNKCLEKLELLEEENKTLKEKLDHFENIEGTLNRAIMMAQKTTDQMKINAHKEADMVLEEAKKNANRIVNEALIRAEKTENEANNLTKNIYVFKRRLKNIIEAQLEMVSDIDKIEL